MSAIGPHKSSFFLLALLLLPMSVVGQEEATVEVESDAIEIAEQLDQTKTEIFDGIENS